MEGWKYFRCSLSERRGRIVACTRHDLWAVDSLTTRDHGMLGSLALMAEIVEDRSFGPRNMRMHPGKCPP